MMRVGIDIGGTFTDLCVVAADGHLVTGKVLSTPRAPAHAFEAVVDAALDDGVTPGTIVELVHATTVATNAILQGDVPLIGLVTTRGFKDVIEIGRHVRRDLYNLFLDKPPPLVPRHHRYEVDERLDATGGVVQPLDEAQLAALAKTISDAALEVVVVAFLHSYANPAHEEAAATYLAAATAATVVTSAGVCQEYREYERFSTAVIHGALRPLVSDYLTDIADRMQARDITAPLSVMQSNGGLASAKMVQQAPALIVESGPAAGVIAAAEVGRRIGTGDVISFDMGGTTAKASIIHGGRPDISRDFEVGGGIQGGYGTGYPIRIPVVDVVEVGTGGGSLGEVDEVGHLRVGPLSAGADPGPACYGRGGVRPTVTDANLLLGRLSTDGFADGQLTLDPVAARRAVFEGVAQPLGTDVTTAAEGIVKLANAQMVRTLELVSIERGHDPRGYTMVAFGGAGPMHAAELAWELGCPRVVVPPEAGVQSAWGLLAGDARRDYSTSILRPGCAHDPDLDYVRRCWEQLAERGMAELESAGFDPQGVIVTQSLDARYRGQAYELTVPVPTADTGDRLLTATNARFHALHDERYGYADHQALVEWVTARVEVTAPVARPPQRSYLTFEAPVATRQAGTQPMVWGGTPYDAVHFRRPDLGSGDVVVGPALISQRDASIAVPPKCAATVNSFGDVVIERQAR